MVNCPNCCSKLEEKEGTKKMCAQIGNPEIAIIETEDPLFCGECNEYFLTTEKLSSAINQIKELKKGSSETIPKGIYR